MRDKLNRRGFAKRSATAIGGLIAGASLSTGECAEDENPDVAVDLLKRGLNAFARAADKNYFADGHRAAAMVSAHFLCVDNHLDQRATSRIRQLVERNWAKTPLCRSFPGEEPAPKQIAKIGEALAERGEILLQVGHNAIFAMLAIKAFRAVPRAATPQRIDGVCRLIRSFTPWRDVDPDPDVKPPPFRDRGASARFILQEASDAIDRFKGFGQGFAGHMLTFGQALVELAAMGDVEWAESCRTAFRKYVTVTRLGPEEDGRRIPDHNPTDLRPTSAAYWEKRGDNTLGIGHVFKYPYAYYDLLRHADAPELARQLNAKAYQIF